MRCPVEAVKLAAQINELRKLSIIDDSTIVERPDAADQFLEVPDELASGTGRHW